MTANEVWYQVGIMISGTEDDQVKQYTNKKKSKLVSFNWNKCNLRIYEYLNLFKNNLLINMTW